MEHTLGQLLAAREGSAVRFCTTQSLGQDLRQHGINGFFRDGRFWSVDMADHWSPGEVANWTHLSATLKEPQ